MKLGLGVPLLVCLLAEYAGLVAQVPPGHVVFTEVALRSAACCGRAGGVFVTHPRVNDQAPITNLPAELLGTIPSVPGFGDGASAVAIRPTDGALLVGERALLGQVVDLHILRLQRLAVVSSTQVPLATAGFDYEGVNDIAVLPAGDAFVAVGAGGSNQIVRVSPSGTVTPVLTSPSRIAAVAVDVANALLLYARQDQGIFAMPLAGGGAQLVYQRSNITNLQVLDPGVVVFTVGPSVLLLDFAVGVPVTLQTGPFNLVLGQLERASLGLVVGTLPVGINVPGTLAYAPRAGTPLTLATTGAITDFTIAENPRVYGTPTPAARTYRWQQVPQPGGLPRIGNAAFGVQVTVTPPGSAAGMLAFAAAPGDVSLLGLRVLLDVRTLVPLIVIPPQGLVPLRIPAEPSLIDAALYLQSFHVDAGGLAASEGVAISIMR
jgi:hypothetical protein